MLLFSSLGPAQALLIDRGAGLIYDDVLDVTWLQDANYARTLGDSADGRMTWEEATTWVDSLSFYDSERDTNWDDWRLPSTLDNLEWGSGYYDLTGENSELSYMYYINLGYEANYSGNTSDPSPASDAYNPFVNLDYRGIWFGTESAATDSAWQMHYHFGFLGLTSIDDTSRAWAVRDGDVATVPEPPEMLLLMTGLTALFFGRRRRRGGSHRPDTFSA
jgi:hypothetical protein